MNWTTSIEFQRDAEFLWHCWWLPKLFLNLDHAKSISAMLGWKEKYRKERYKFWNENNIAEISYEGGLAASPELFETLKEHGTGWREDRADALQNINLLLHQNIEGLIWHWQQLAAHEQAQCLGEAEALQRALDSLTKVREVA